MTPIGNMFAGTLLAANGDGMFGGAVPVLMFFAILVGTLVFTSFVVTRVARLVIERA